MRKVDVTFYRNPERLILIVIPTCFDRMSVYPLVYVLLAELPKSPSQNCTKNFPISGSQGNPWDGIAKLELYLYTGRCTGPRAPKFCRESFKMNTTWFQTVLGYSGNFRKKVHFGSFLYPFLLFKIFYLIQSWNSFMEEKLIKRSKFSSWRFFKVFPRPQQW